VRSSNYYYIVARSIMRQQTSKSLKKYENYVSENMLKNALKIAVVNFCEKK